MPHSVLSPQQKPKNSKRKENLIFDLNCVALPDKIYEAFKIHGLYRKPGKWVKSTLVDKDASERVRAPLVFIPELPPSPILTELKWRGGLALKGTCPSQGKEQADVIFLLSWRFFFSWIDLQLSLTQSCSYCTDTIGECPHYLREMIFVGLSYKFEYIHSPYKNM